MDISAMCILIVNVKFWTTCLLLMEQCMHLVLSNNPFKALSIHVNPETFQESKTLFLLICNSLLKMIPLTPTSWRAILRR